MEGKNPLLIVLAALAVCILVVAGFFGLLATGKAFNRYQKRADAENNVRVTEIQIRNQQQRVEIAKQRAEIRLQEAIGIRKAQDEINETLTPFYLTHEYIQALRESKAQTVYIPTDPRSGLPVVTTRNAVPETP